MEISSRKGKMGGGSSSNDVTCIPNLWQKDAGLLTVTSKRELVCGGVCVGVCLYMGYVCVEGIWV